MSFGFLVAPDIGAENAMRVRYAAFWQPLSIRFACNLEAVWVV